MNTVMESFNASASAKPRAHRVSTRWPWAIWQLGLLAVTAAFGLLQRHDLSTLEQSVGARANLWDHLLMVTGSPYLWVFALLPAWLLWTSLSVSQESDWALLVRSGTHLRWLRHSLTSAGRRLLVLLLALIASAIATGSGLSWDAGWSALTVKDPAAVSSLASIGATVPVSLLAQVLWPGIALLGWHLVLAVTQIGLRHAPTTMGVALIGWCWTAIAHRELGYLPSFLSPNVALSLPAALEVGPSAVFAQLLPVSIAAAAGFLLDRRTRFRTPGPSAGFLAISGLGIVVLSATRPTDDVGTALVGVLYGVGTDGTSWPLYLLNAVLITGPAYLFALHLRAWRDCLPIMVLRHGSYLGWFANMARPWLWRVPLGLSIAAGLVALLAVLHAPDADQTVPELIAPALFQWIVNGSLQTWLGLAVVFLTVWLWNTDHAALVAVAGLVILGFPTLNSSRLLPFGLAGTGWSLAGWPTIGSIAAQLASWLFVLALAGLAILVRPTSKINERNLE